MNYWLFKSEESVFSIEDLANSPGKKSSWEGVRNYQVRNYLRDEIKKGDLLFFYHSNCKIPGIAGVAEVSKNGYPDSFAWDKKSKYYDARSAPEKPVWYMVDVKLRKRFKSVVPLANLRENRKLKDMKVLQKGCRLSITPVTKREWDVVMEMAE